jgi:hypothetical protein
MREGAFLIFVVVNDRLGHSVGICTASICIIACSISELRMPEIVA